MSQKPLILKPRRICSIKKRKQMRKKKTHDRNRGVGPVRQVEGSPGCQPRPAGDANPVGGRSDGCRMCVFKRLGLLECL